MTRISFGNLRALCGNPRLVRFATSGASRAALTLMNVGFVAIIGHRFGLAVLGYFSAYLSYVTVATVVLAAGYPVVAIRRLARHQLRGKKQKAIWRKSIILSQFMIGVPIVLLTLPAVGVVYNKIFYALGGVEIVLSLIFAPIGVGCLRVLSEDLRAADRLEAAITVDSVATAVLPFVMSVILALADPGTMRGAEIARLLLIAHAALSCLGAVGYCSWALSRTDRFHRRLMFALTAPRLLSDLFFVVMTQAGTVALSAAPSLLIAGTSSASSAGVMSIIQRLVGLSATATNIIQNVMSASIARAARDGERLRRLYWESALLNGAVSFVVLAFPAFAPTIALRIFGATKVESSAVLALLVLAWGRIIRAFLGINDLFLVIAGKAKLEAISLLISILAMVATLALAGHVSVFSVAASLTISTLSRVGVSLIFCQMHLFSMRRGRP